MNGTEDNDPLALDSASAGYKNWVWQQSRQVAQIDENDHVILLRMSPPSESPIVLRDVSAFLWRLLSEDLTFADLVEATAEAFGISSEQAATSIGPFLHDLEERQLAWHVVERSQLLDANVNASSTKEYSPEGSS
ncbi:PqqD family protein [Rathayibacter sp. VKM Ac-2754]|uniref:PqqD family protein n=1 Tax=Rathayibacter sp. VKM Ac-2754 TaxID=2609251 RepID=UPI00135801C7|nr:PqqD family protein [Rathayibacter sp. VKM Ac-2754]